MRMKLTIAMLLASTSIVSAGDAGPTAVGVGIGSANSSSSSASKATAIGGGNANSAGGNSAATVNIAGNPANTTSTINNTGTSTIKNVPAVFAPGLAAAGLETCLGSVSGGGAFVGTGFSFGTTIPDPGCATRLDARTLWSFGLKRQAIARLCINGDIYNSMPDVCSTYLPIRTAPQVVVPVGAVVPMPTSGTFSYNADHSIMLVDGKTGVEHLCTNYDEPKQRCRVWADAVVRTKYAANRKRLRHIDPVISTSVAQQEDKTK
jgi:hypothetical protein